MNLSRNSPVVSTVAGLALGPWLYGWANDAPTQVSWFAYQVAFLVVTLGIFVIIAAQVLMRQVPSARASSKNVFAGTLFFVASGAAGWLAATYRGEVAFPALLTLAMGLGGLAGLAISRVVFRDAFAT